MNVAFNETTGIASFDVQLLNRTQRTHYLPIRLLITDIRPDDIAVVDFDGEWVRYPFYSFNAQLGGGDVLAPGARTEPVTMKFHTVTARSFAIGFRLILGPAANTGTIGGVAYLKISLREEPCPRCEPGIPGVTIALEKTLENGDKVTLLAVTDSIGEYSFSGLGAGVYKVSVVMPEHEWVINSQNPLLVTLVKGPDGKAQDFLEADFGILHVSPPIPRVTILFGPIATGLFSPFGTEIDTTFVDPPSPLAVVYKYYLNVEMPGLNSMPNVVDSAEAWINGEMIFKYVRIVPPDTVHFAWRAVEIRDGLVKAGENTIHLHMYGDEWATLNWSVFKKP